MRMSVELWLARAMLGSIALLGSPAASPGGTWYLPFTVTTPTGKGPFPAVVTRVEDFLGKHLAATNPR
jgi:hypothetical protein